MATTAAACSPAAITLTSCSTPSAPVSPTFPARRSARGRSAHACHPERLLSRARDLLLVCAVALITTPAFAGGLEQLQAFVDGAKSGRATMGSRFRY